MASPKDSPKNDKRKSDDFDNLLQSLETIDLDSEVRKPWRIDEAAEQAELENFRQEQNNENRSPNSQSARSSGTSSRRRSPLEARLSAMPTLPNNYLVKRLLGYSNDMLNRSVRSEAEMETLIENEDNAPETMASDSVDDEVKTDDRSNDETDCEKLCQSSPIEQLLVNGSFDASKVKHIDKSFKSELSLTQCPEEDEDDGIAILTEEEFFGSAMPIRYEYATESRVVKTRNDDTSRVSINLVFNFIEEEESIELDSDEQETMSQDEVQINSQGEINVELIEDAMRDVTESPTEETTVLPSAVTKIPLWKNTKTYRGPSRNIQVGTGENAPVRIEERRREDRLFLRGTSTEDRPGFVDEFYRITPAISISGSEEDVNEPRVDWNLLDMSPEPKSGTSSDDPDGFVIVDKNTPASE